METKEIIFRAKTISALLRLDEDYSKETAASDINELKDDLVKLFSMHFVVGQSEQYCECGWFQKGEKKELNSYLVCKHCEKYL